MMEYYYSELHYRQWWNITTLEYYYIAYKMEYYYIAYKYYYITTLEYYYIAYKMEYYYIAYKTGNDGILLLRITMMEYYYSELQFTSISKNRQFGALRSLQIDQNRLQNLGIWLVLINGYDRPALRPNKSWNSNIKTKSLNWYTILGLMK